MKAPEKLYLPKRNKLPLEVVRGCEWYETDPQCMYGSVEYTSTDAFIDKTCDWLDDLVLSDYVDIKETSDGTFVTFNQDKLVKDFRTYMKGE